MVFSIYKPSSYWGTPMTMETPTFWTWPPDRHRTAKLPRSWSGTGYGARWVGAAERPGSLGSVLGGVQLGLLMGITISITMVYRWYIFNNITISGWWYTYPSEKYESQSEGLSHILWKQKNVWNHVTRYGKNFHKTRWHVTRTTMVNYNPLTNPSIRWCPWETLAKLI